MQCAMRVAAGWMLGVMAVISADSTTSARAQRPEPGPRLDKLVYVLGRDREIAFAGALPAACAETTVTLGYYTRGGAAQSNPRNDGLPTVTVRVGVGGAISGRLPLPATLPLELQISWPGIAGGCLSAPLIAGQAQLALLDPEENPGVSATLVVPARSLNSTGTIPGGPTNGGLIRSFTVYAGAKACRTADLTSKGERDKDGNVRIHVGGPDQPAECSVEGTTLTLTNADGARLYETREFLAGVSQPFWNLAPEPPSAGGAPGAPSTGSGSDVELTQSSDGSGGPRAIGLALAALVAGIAVTAMVARRRSSRART